MSSDQYFHIEIDSLRKITFIGYTMFQLFQMSYICTWMLSAEEAEEDTEEGLRLINRLNSVCSGVDNI